jgi:hypothetical protein
MNKLGSVASATVMGMLAGPEGMNSGLSSLSAPDSSLARPIDPEQMMSENVAAELADHSLGNRYPAIYVYCDQITNALTEKFRTFSGHVRLTIEVRHSQDRLAGLQTALELYADSITQVLDTKRGDWGNGMYYPGGYQVAVAQVKHGGRNFLQTAKIALQVEVSRN